MNDERSRRGDDSLQEIAGLWERTSANGREYIGGRTSDDAVHSRDSGRFLRDGVSDDSDNPRARRLAVVSPPRGRRGAGGTSRKGRIDRF